MEIEETLGGLADSSGTFGHDGLGNGLPMNAVISILEIRPDSNIIMLGGDCRANTMYNVLCSSWSANRELEWSECTGQLGDVPRNAGLHEPKPGIRSKNWPNLCWCLGIDKRGQDCF